MVAETLNIWTGRHIAVAAFDLLNLPTNYAANAYAHFVDLRANSREHRNSDGTYLLTRFADMVDVYRSPNLWSSEKHADFKPKFGTRRNAFRLNGRGGGRGKINRIRIAASMHFMLNAGDETSTNIIYHGIHAFLRNPSEVPKLQAGPSLPDSAAEEILRYQAPIQINNRRSTADKKNCRLIITFRNRYPPDARRW